ncbi:MAG: site-specific integrase [Xanthobacteraceae bacterium]
MARTIRDATLDTRAARSRLQPRGKPHYRAIEEGLHLGYRKPRGRKGNPAVAGKWVARHYLGAQAYQVEIIGTADDFCDADGVAILSYAQAQARARERMVRRKHADVGETGPVTVADAIEDYLSFLKSMRKSAVDARARVNAFVLPELGDIEVDSLTTKHLTNWHHKLAQMPPRLRTRKGEKQKHRAMDKGDEDAKRRRQSSANRTLTYLKAALNLAWRGGRVSSDALWRRVEPFKNVDVARLRYLTLTEAQRLINACESDFRSLVQAALQTGARYGELARLQVCDFNPEAGTLVILQSKSGKPRHVVLTDEGLILFNRLTAGRAGQELLLSKADGGPWLPSHQGRPMQAACERAKIIPPISFHGLRHTWASLAVMGGVPLLVVAKNLGHTDTRMVERHYGHLAPSYITDAIRAGAPRFGAVEPSKPEQLLRLRGKEAMLISTES